MNLHENILRRPFFLKNYEEKAYKSGKHNHFFKKNLRIIYFNATVN